MSGNSLHKKHAQDAGSIYVGKHYCFNEPVLSDQFSVQEQLRPLTCSLFRMIEEIRHHFYYTVKTKTDENFRIKLFQGHLFFHLSNFLYTTHQYIKQ